MNSPPDGRQNTTELLEHSLNINTLCFRHQKLSESEEFQIFVGKVEEEEAWMNEKQQILASDNYGENMAAVQGLLKKHDAFDNELEVHKKRVNDLIREGQQVQ